MVGLFSLKSVIFAFKNKSNANYFCPTIKHTSSKEGV